MSLAHALLVSLAEQEATGYDLTRRFDASLGHFWNATHQQIYRVLSGLHDDGLLRVRVEPGDGKPDRRIYSVTDAGYDHLRALSRKPSPEERVRSAFAVKVRGMPFSDPAAVVEDIRRQRATHAKKLQYYEANCAKNYPHPDDVSGDDLPRYLVLRGGIRSERALLEWCDEMLDAFGAAAVTQSNYPHQKGHGAQR